MIDTLYKYLPPARVDVLTQGRIRFSPVSELNDPFESRPRVRAIPESAARRARAEGRTGNEVARAVAGFVGYVALHGTDVLWKTVNVEFGILSLTANPLQPVMWGHYADSYRGYVLGFDAQHPWLAPEPHGTDVTSRPRSVHYQLDRPQVDIGDGEGYNAEAFLVGSILTKHQAWAFEEEYRIAKDTRGALRPEGPRGVTNLFPVPPDAVTEIITGPRMTDADLKTLRAAILSGSFPRARLRRLRLPDDTYALEIID